MTYDLAIIGGRVIDPESGLDAVRNLGVNGGRIETLTDSPLDGNAVIDADGLVVAPGFIDLHSHGQDAENYEVQARDGVTTALELEVGAGDMDSWYEDRRGTSLINYGASVGHIPVRIEVMDDPGDFLPVADAAYREATTEELGRIKEGIEHGLRRGALAVGFGLDYTRGCSRWEVIEAFRIAAKYNAPCHVHIRGKGHMEPMSGIEAAGEVIAAAAVTGAPLHIVHIQSTGMHATGNTLAMIQGTRERGLDVTTECYPYAAGMTAIDSALFSEGWQQKYGISYDSLQWADTGERLTSSTFAEYRETGRHGHSPLDAAGRCGHRCHQPPVRHSDRRLPAWREGTSQDGGHLLTDTRPIRSRARAAVPLRCARQVFAHAGPEAPGQDSRLRQEGQNRPGHGRRLGHLQPVHSKR